MPHANSTHTVQFHVIDGPRKAWTWITTAGETCEGPACPDLALVKEQDPRNVRRTYAFTTDPAGVELPHKGTALRPLLLGLLVAQSRGIDPSTLTFALIGDCIEVV